MPFKYMSWWSGDLCGPSSSLSIEEMLEEKTNLEKNNPHNVHEDKIPECIILQEKKSFQMGATLTRKQNISEFKLHGEEQATLFQHTNISGF